MERKSECFCGVNFFRFNFKVEWENGVWTNIRFLASDFLFTCGNLLWFLLFFRFFGSDFFKWFSRSNLSSVEPNFHFSLVVFCSHAEFWHWFSVFFKFFIWFYWEMVFPIRLYSILGLIFVQSMKILWIVRQDLSCYVFCFVVWRSFSFYICSHSKAEKIKFSEWLLPLTNGIFARVVISQSL